MCISCHFRHFKLLTENFGSNYSRNLYSLSQEGVFLKAKIYLSHVIILFVEPYLESDSFQSNSNF